MIVYNGMFDALGNSGKKEFVFIDKLFAYDICLIYLLFYYANKYEKQINPYIF